MELASISMLVSSLKTATDVAQGILRLKSTAEVQGKVIEIQSALLAAQSSALAATQEQFSLQERVRELEAELKAVEDWGDQEGRYSLVSPWRSPAQVYALRESRADGERPHLLCTNCFLQRKRSIVGPRKTKENNVNVVCPVCRATLDTGLRGLASVKFAEAYEADAEGQ